MGWRWQEVAKQLSAPRFGAELGVSTGRFTEHMLATFPEIQMIAVDEWRSRDALDRVGFETYAEWNFERIKREFAARTAPFADRLTVLNCDTEAAAALVDRRFDFVFIDAEHTYEGVRDDIRAWRDKIVPGGLLCGHDYSKKFPGVKLAVDELNLPVTRAHDSVWMIRL